MMANITAADVKKLRELTGAGMMDCKKALTEAEGDFEKAAELIRIKLGKKHMPRWVAVLVLYACLLSMLAGAVMFAVP